MVASSSHIKITFKHALIYGSAGIIGKAIGFIMLPIYSHHLQVEGYGVIGMIDTVLSVMTLLIGYGISGAMSRFYYETDNEEQRKIIVSTTILLMFVLVLIVTVPALLFSKPIAWLAFGRSDWQQYITLAILAFIATMTAKNAENYLYILQRSMFMSAISLCRLVISLSLNIHFIVFLQLGVLGYLYASLIDGVLYTFFMHYISMKNVGFGFDKVIARRVLAFSLPMLPGYIAMFIRNNADRVLLRTFMGLAQVGVFEVLFKFATLVGFLVVEPFSKIWNVKRFEICDQEDGPQIIAQTFTYYLALLFFFGLILSLEIPHILKLLTPESFWVNGIVVYFAVMSRIFNASYYHVYFGLLYAKKTFKISIVRLLDAIVSLSLTFPLIWLYGFTGVVFASVLSSLVLCLLGYFTAKSYYFIPFEWGKILRMFILMLLFYLLAKNFTIIGTILELYVDKYIVPFIESICCLFKFDQVRDGKLLKYLIDVSSTVIDVVILFIYSLCFVPCLVIIGIIPFKRIKYLLKIKKIGDL
jgi:O-antigen/teichoic acid export membrane protein